MDWGQWQTTRPDSAGWTTASTTCWRRSTATTFSSWAGPDPLRVLFVCSSSFFAQLFYWFRFALGAGHAALPLLCIVVYVGFGRFELVASFSTRLFESGARVRLRPRASLERFAVIARAMRGTVRAQRRAHCAVAPELRGTRGCYLCLAWNWRAAPACERASFIWILKHPGRRASPLRAAFASQMQPTRGTSD